MTEVTQEGFGWSDVQSVCEEIAQIDQGGLYEEVALLTEAARTELYAETMAAAAKLRELHDYVIKDAATGRTWDDLFPDGRVVFYEGGDPDGFASEMADLGIDVRANPLDWDEAFSFYIPAGRMEEIYGSGRWPLGS